MVSFHATKTEHNLISKIVIRALHAAVDAGVQIDKGTMQMDLEACHCNGNPLRLKKLLAFPAFDFAHDVFGIRRYMNRKTGKLTQCFLPRSTNMRKLRKESPKVIA